jgi:hypothetical protein
VFIFIVVAKQYFDPWNSEETCLLGISQSETIMRKLNPPTPFSPPFLVNKCSNIAYKSSSDDYIYVQESLQELACKMQSLKIHWAHNVLS